MRYLFTSLITLTLQIQALLAATFTLTESIITPNGVIIANYKRAEKVKTGTIGS